MKKSCMPRGRKKWKRRSRRRNSESPGRRLPRSETQLGTPSRLLAGARLAGGPGVLYLVVKMGDKVKVKIIAIDPVNGKVKLSRRQALTPEETAAEVERLGLTAVAPGSDDDRPPRREGGFGDRDRGP